MTYTNGGNDGRFPENCPVEVRYPRDKQEENGDRESWPRLPGSVLEQCGPDEWRVCVEVHELATLQDGSKPRKNTPPDRLYYPCCFRDSSELRRVQFHGIAPFAGDRAVPLKVTIIDFSYFDACSTLALCQRRE